MQYRYFEMIINDFSSYISPINEVSVVKGIPMSFRDHPTIKEFERAGGKVRYRGPRPRGKGGKYWDRHLARSTCLKQDATTFAVYPHGR
jgi:hypothetical protein